MKESLGACGDVSSAEILHVLDTMHMDVTHHLNGQPV